MNIDLLIQSVNIFELFSKVATVLALFLSIFKKYKNFFFFFLDWFDKTKVTNKFDLFQNILKQIQQREN